MSEIIHDFGGEAAVARFDVTGQSHGYLLQQPAVAVRIAERNGQPFPDGAKIVKLQWKPKKSTEAPFVVDVPDVFAQAFVMEKDSWRFPKTGGWGYAVFNYDAASDSFTADPKSLSDCGNACHRAVKAKDYIFHPYEKR